MGLRSYYDNVVIDVEGNALADVEVTVWPSDDVGGTEATIYATKGGGGTVANPITTDATGLVNFWANPGEYVLSFHDTELPERISDRDVTWGAVSGDDEGIDQDQLEPDTYGVTHVAMTGTNDLSLDSGGALTTITGMDQQLPSGLWYVVGKLQVTNGSPAAAQVQLQYAGTAVDISEVGNMPGAASVYEATLPFASEVTSNGSNFTRVRASSAGTGKAWYGRLVAIKMS